MAEGLLFNIIEKLISKLGSVVLESWNVRDDLERLVSNMSEIKAVVLDAEEQQGNNNQVQVWLDQLKDVLYDAEDLLDDFSTEDLRRQVLTRGKNAKKVRIFFSSSNQLVFSFKMSKKIKEIGKRLENLNVDRKHFNFINRTPELRVLNQRQTHSFIREEDVIGREKEKKELMELLLSTNMDMKENISIISIIGFGGLGKTALAQFLYNDKEVQLHFELKKWVCVSDDFDVKAIAMKIIESTDNTEMDKVQEELRKKVGGRRYLLVLDDVWNEDREHWLQLMTLLMDGAKGSKIIVTTRSEMVAKIIGTSSSYFLKGLDEEQSWKLFSQLAFDNDEGQENQKLVLIGKEIVKKCSGVPLAIRSIASLMYSKETENEWLNFKVKDLGKIDEQGDNRVHQILKLSYDHLPFHLKKCFAFCSLFPKDYMIRRKSLIQLWVAEGFIQSSDESTCLEDVGEEYFMALAHRSFFQDFERSELYHSNSQCKMHDLVHDLAKYVSRNDCVTVTEKGLGIDKRARHLSFDFPLHSSWQVPSSLLKENKLRTFLLPQNCFFFSMDLCLAESTFNLLMSCLEQLRVLDLNYLTLRMLPSCIGKMKHLRYLNLSSNKQIEELPKSITKLNNLQTLLLSGCSRLKELPKDIWKLVSLRHLDLEGCDRLTFMPHGIGQLTNLQTLTLFVLNTNSLHSKPTELMGLKNLRGNLNIKGLECLRRNPTEAKDINLLGKPHLQQLELSWGEQIDATHDDMDKDIIILECLLLFHNIRDLGINGFGGLTISGSFNSFTNLLHISLQKCTRLQYLPQLHLLLHLKSLLLSNLLCLEWIYSDRSNYSSSTFFPSLQLITLEELPNLKGCCRCKEEGKLKDCWHQFKSLRELHIFSCSNLVSVPQYTYVQWMVVENVSEKILQQAVNHSKVESLEIVGINDLKSLSGILQHLIAVQDLCISNCEELDPCNDEDGCYTMQWKQLINLRDLEFSNIPKMESLPEGLQHVATLRSLKIEDCVNLRYIPEWLTSLQRYNIKNCPNLTSLPEGVKVLEN